MVRTYLDIYRDYTKWLVDKTGDPSYHLDNLLDTYDKNSVYAMLYKSILEHCYDKENGMYYFCKFIIGDLREIGFPKKFRFNTLLRQWDKQVKANKYLAILCARGHGKSVYFSQILNIYDMLLFKHRRILVISSNQEQAETILDEMSRIIDNNEWLTSKKDGDWRAGKLSFNGGYIIGKGIGSEILGQHVDRIVIDDILRQDNKLSDEEIEDYIDMTLDPMLLNRNGQMIIVGTPKSETDIFVAISNRIREGSVWQLFKFPAIIDYETRKMQCPDRFTWESLMQKRLSMGPLKFAREYQLEFFSRDNSLFTDQVVDLAKDKGKGCFLLDKADKRPPNWTFVMGVDVARSGAVSADYSVAIVMAYNSVTQEKQVVHVWREKGSKIRNQAESIAYIARAFNFPYILVEENNMGRDMIEELVDKWNLNVDSFVTGGKGQKKEELIRFLICAFEYEQIILPMGDERSIAMSKELEYELKKFCVVKTPAGNEQFKGVGAHDDLVMALALVNRATQTAGVPFAIASSKPGGSLSDTYSTMINSFNNRESDLVKLIQLGVIK